LSYQNAQDVIEGKTLGSVPVIPEHNAPDIEHDIKVLHDIAQALRKKRFESGALALGSTRLSFTINDDGLPVDCDQYARYDANILVEEFMLLANISVAQHIAVHLPEQALLRRHDAPIERRLNGFRERAARLGIPVDTTSSGTMMKSFNAITDPSVRRILELLSFKATHRAKYFCAGMLDIAKYGHYALNVPLYTHFTSPIRRYADIIVHRQLEAVMQAGATGRHLRLCA
jgi:protein SSD1